MQKVIIDLIMRELLSEKGRKMIIIVVGASIIFLFLPIIIILIINPFSAFNESNSNNDPYIIMQKNIQKSKNVSVDINIERAIDTVFYNSSMDNESAIEGRANKYLYTQQEVTEKVLQYMHDYIKYPQKLSQNNIKSIQQALNALGYNIPADGKLTDITMNAIKLFQNKSNIKPADGSINQGTWDALFNNKLESNITIQDGKIYKIVIKKYIIYVANNLDTAINILKKNVTVSSYQESQIREIYQYSLLDEEASTYGGSGSITPPPITKSTQDFINDIKDAAIKTYQEYHILPSITLAQGIIESGSGGSSLSRKYNNLFGIKASSAWKGQTVQLPTKETYNGVTVTIMGTFRVYNNWGDSIEDHGKFVSENSTYRLHGLFNATDYSGQASDLQAAGYATDPNYAQELIGLIKEYHLDQYDTQTIN